MTTYLRIMMMAALAVAAAASPARAQAPATPTSADAGRAAAEASDVFGPVSIPRAVRANGAALEAGSYSVRITGETSEQERWVEFLANGRVAGRELATTIPMAEIGTVAKLTPLSAGDVRVDTLRGEDYVRVWVNAAGTHYLVHLPVG